MLFHGLTVQNPSGYEWEQNMTSVRVMRSFAGFAFAENNLF
jgi:hypothetical protein